jgi:hypothetical protein
VVCSETTVKAPKFGPLLFQKALVSMKRVIQKNEKRIKVTEKLKIYKFGSVHFLIHYSSKEATELATNGPRFP